MKCVKNSVEVRKVSDIEAIDMVKHGWNYCAKKEFKKLHGKSSSVKVEKKEVMEGDMIEVKKKPIKMSKEDRLKAKARGN